MEGRWEHVAQMGCVGRVGWGTLLQVWLQDASLHLPGFGGQALA